VSDVGRDDEAAADQSDSEISQTPPTDDLTFDEAITEQENAEEPS